MEANKSLFLKYLGDTPQLKILDFLIDNHFFDFPLTEIARESNVSYNTLSKIFPDFVEKEIVNITRKMGKSDYYQLNLEHPFIKSLMQLDWTLSKGSMVEIIPDLNIKHRVGEYGKNLAV